MITFDHNQLKYHDLMPKKPLMPRINYLLNVFLSAEFYIGKRIELYTLCIFLKLKRLKIIHMVVKSKFRHHFLFSLCGPDTNSTGYKISLNKLGT